MDLMIVELVMVIPWASVLPIQLLSSVSSVIWFHRLSGQEQIPNLVRWSAKRSHIMNMMCRTSE